MFLNHQMNKLYLSTANTTQIPKYCPNKALQHVILLRLYRNMSLSGCLLRSSAPLQHMISGADSTSLCRHYLTLGIVLAYR